MSAMAPPQKVADGLVSRVPFVTVHLPGRDARHVPIYPGWLPGIVLSVSITMRSILRPTARAAVLRV